MSGILQILRRLRNIQAGDASLSGTSRVLSALSRVFCFSRLMSFPFYEIALLAGSDTWAILFCLVPQRTGVAAIAEMPADSSRSCSCIFLWQWDFGRDTKYQVGE